MKKYLSLAILIFSSCLFCIACSSGGAGSAPASQTNDTLSASQPSAEETSVQNTIPSVADTPAPTDNSASNASAAPASDENTTPDETSSSSVLDTFSPSQEGEQPSQALDQLEDTIETIIGDSGMDISVAIVDLTTGSQLDIDADKQKVSASMIKPLIAAAFLEQVDKGIYTLDDSYTLTDADIVGGTGYLASYGAGSRVTYQELIHAMISASDNTATNAIISLVGMDAVNTEASTLGLEASQLNRLMMDESAIAAGIENYTSANDLASLFQRIYAGAFVNPEASQVVLSALEAQQDNVGMASGLPADATFAHKTGSLGTVRHDGGIVEGSHPFVIVALCDGDGFYAEGANAAMSQIADAAYRFLVAEGA